MELVEQTRKIYNSLRDDLSKQIFENKILFSLTQNSVFTDNIIELTFGYKSRKEEWNLFYGKYDHVIVYGAGSIGKLFAATCDKTDITAFCDRNEKKQKKGCLGYDVISPEELKEKYNYCTVIICVLSNRLVTEITADLLKAGFSRSKILVFKDKFDANHVGEMYFDNSVITPDIHNTEEVFVDTGCLDFGSSLDFIDWCGGNYKKIIAFEPNPKQYPVCVKSAGNNKNATVFPYGLWDEATELSFNNNFTNQRDACISRDTENIIKIKTIKLDDVLNGEKVTFIKMDIEGAELNALKGAEQTIKKYRPKLAISVYHKPEDIWEIPAYILSLHEDYKLYLRHYCTSSSETVLYAV